MKTEVRVQIKYLTSLRDHTGRREEEVSFPSGATLRDVAAWLKEQYSLSLPDSQIMATLNGKGWDQFPLKWSTPVEDGDVILLFAPIAGG